MSEKKIRFLTKKDIQKTITLKDAIKEVKETFSNADKDHVVDRLIIKMEKGQGSMLYMPFYAAKKKILGAKIVGVFPQNLDQDLPLICGMLVLFNAETGQTLSVMDAELITAMRTAAVTAIATDILAKKESKHFALFGAGVQGTMQAEAIFEIRDIHKAWIYDIKEEKSRVLTEILKNKYSERCEIISSNSPGEIIKEADIIVTATTSHIPVFDGSLIREGTHITAIGAFKPDCRELDENIISRGRIFVDSYSQCLKEAGDLIMALESGAIEKSAILGDLTALVRGEIKGRKSDQDITILKSVGMALQDVALASFIYRNALEQNLGTVISLDE